MEGEEKVTVGPRRWVVSWPGVEKEGELVLEEWYTKRDKQYIEAYCAA